MKKRTKICIIVLIIILLLVGIFALWCLYDYNTYTKVMMSNELLVEDEGDKNSKSYHQNVRSGHSCYASYLPFPNMVTTVQVTLMNIESERYKMLIDDDAKVYYVDMILFYNHNVFSRFKTPTLEFEVSTQEFYEKGSGISYGQGYQIITDTELNLISEDVEGLYDLSYDYIVEAKNTAVDFFGENIFE